MGGLMITEPDYGSDALNMQTSNYKQGTNYHIRGTKHWQGLTGLADYWIVSSRHIDEKGNLGRDIDFFISDEQQVNQRIEVVEYYNNMGLYLIPYGKNKINIQVPEQFKLQPESTGLKLMVDLLHRSRYHISGMGMGFVKRMLDEAIMHCKSRFVGGKALLTFDQVKHQISRIQSAYTICSAMCVRSAEHSGIENNLTPDSIEANSIKTYVTDLMQESAQTLTQLYGANGYKTESLGTRGIVDSRPFQIFEGANDMLYSQISEMVVKIMQRKNVRNLVEFLKEYDLTSNIAGYFKSTLNFLLDFKMAQRKAVDLGKIISRVVCANLVGELANKGFRNDLIRESLETINHDINMLVSSYKFKSRVSPIVEYKESSNWLTFL
jgi:alkylation response protein AidB-like acyl-CoA dehydrogenase